MRPLSMSLPMTNVSTHRFDYVASTALHYGVSSQQRSYFSVLEQVAQASPLQQQLRLFLQDEDNPSLNNSLTSANFYVITQKIGFFSHNFLRLLLTVTDSTPQPESVELQPVLRSARAPVVEPQVESTQPLISA